MEFYMKPYASHTPAQNGLVERKNRHILETTHALLLGGFVPQCYWVSLHDKKDIGVIIHLLGETNSNQSEEHIWFEIKMGEGTTTTDDEIGTEISFLA
ncbi:unnamed protein product [Prunus armeniaca]